MKGKLNVHHYPEKSSNNVNVSKRNYKNSLLLNKINHIPWSQNSCYLNWNRFSTTLSQSY